MKTLGEIKQMMAAGDTAKAAEALKELLAKEPENLQAKMLYGTCCQLLGDEDTFKRIHGELAPEMEKQEKVAPQSEMVSLWKKYHALWMTLIFGGLVLVSLTGAAIYFGSTTKNQMNVLYGGAMYAPVSKGTKAAIELEQEDVFSREEEEACRKLEEQRRSVEEARNKAEEEDSWIPTRWQSRKTR